MSAEIVNLPRRDEGSMVWVCNCGCTTHYHRADGEVSCGACEAIVTALRGDWRKRLPPLPVEVPDMADEHFKTVDLGGADAFLRRQIKGGLIGEMRAIVILMDDGAITTWRDAMDTDARAAWLRRKLARAARIMLPKAARA